MKVAIIGSTQYKDKMLKHKEMLKKQGHEARIPALDDLKVDQEIDICRYNLDMIKWADRVDIFWDCRSMGAVFDFGMAFALGKPIKVVYLEKKTFMNVLRQWEQIPPKIDYIEEDDGYND